MARSCRGKRKNSSPTHGRAGHADARRDVHGRVRPVRLAGAQVLARHRGGGAHEADRGPGDEREELGVGDRVRRLRRGALRQRADERQQEHAADVHRDPLNAGRQAEPEQLPDDRPVGPEAVAAREPHHPAAAPELDDRVDRDEPRGEGGPHRRAGRPERGDRTEAADQDDVEDDVEDRHDDAEDHRRARVAGRAERAASMKKISMPLLNRNMMRRNGSASAFTAGAALTRSSSDGARK